MCIYVLFLIYVVSSHHCIDISDCLYFVVASFNVLPSTVSQSMPSLVYLLPFVAGAHISKFPVSLLSTKVSRNYCATLLPHTSIFFDELFNHTNPKTKIHLR